MKHLRELPATLRRLRADHLLRNSFFILLATAVMAALGFLFWLSGSRLYTPAEIGGATSLISAMSLISYVSQFGFNIAVVRYLPTSADRSRDVNAGLVVVLGAGIVFSVAFVGSLPWIAPDLNWLRSSWPMALTFCLVSALSAANLFTDSVFIAMREARYNLLINGFVMSGSRLALPVLLTGAGPFGLVAAAGIGSSIATVVSLLALTAVVRYRPRMRLDWAPVRAAARFNLAAYTASLFNLAPIVVLPIVTLNALGAEPAGYFFIAFQVANLLNAVAYAVCQSLLAEGSHLQTRLGQLMRRSVLVLGVSIVPGALVIAMVSRPMLRIFGADYARGAPLLALLAGSAVTVAAYCWVSTMLKLTGQLRALVLTNVAYAAVIIGLAVALAPRGLAWIGVAWCAGNVAATAIGGLALVTHRRSSTAGGPANPGWVRRHRRGSPARRSRTDARRKLMNLEVAS